MTEADRHEMAESYQKATRAFDVQKYDEAITAYKKTYELGGDAPMLYNIAQALRLSKHPDEAVVYYRRYLDRAPSAPNQKEVRARIAELTGKSEEPATAKPTPGAPAPAKPALATAKPTPGTPATAPAPAPAKPAHAAPAPATSATPAGAVPPRAPRAAVKE